VTVFKGLSWWQGVLVFAPVLLAVEGGAVGGLFGGVAALSCGVLARRGWHALLTAAAMVCIDALAWGAYLGVAALLFGAHVLPWSGPAVPQAGQSFLQAPATLAPLPAAVSQASQQQQPSSCASPAAAVPGPSAPGGTADPPAGSGAASAASAASADFTGTRIAVSGTADRAQIGAGPYSITLLGNLGCGAHADVSPADPGSGPQVLVEVNGRGCGNFDGAITVYEMATDSSGAIIRLNAAFSIAADPSGAVTQLNATFSARCQGPNQLDPKAGFIRFNATAPTPVPVLPGT
jgi:hypothetical protein